MPQDIAIELGDWTLERGCVITNDVVRGRLYGPEDGPLIIVLGGISADRFVADSPDDGFGWWSPLVRPGGPIDLNRFRVLGIDFAPGAAACPETITTADQAKRMVALLKAHDLRADGIVGSSYGGMCALRLAQDAPESVRRLCVISAAHRPFSIGVAWRGIQRRIVRLGMAADTPREGLKLARELAMTTYRTPEEFADRFALSETASDPARFDICDYLESRGNAFADRMDAQRFLALSESVDLHRARPESISQPTLLITATSDQLAPLQDMRELRDRLGGPAELYTFISLFGHDAFLKEWDALSPPLARWCGEIER